MLLALSNPVATLLGLSATGSTMNTNLNFLSTPTVLPNGGSPLAIPTSGDGVPQNQVFQALLTGQMFKAERQGLAAQVMEDAGLQVISLGTKLNVITTDEPLPDLASLAAFARTQGLAETAIQALFGSATAPKTSPAGLTQGQESATTLFNLGTSAGGLEPSSRFGQSSMPMPMPAGLALAMPLASVPPAQESVPMAETQAKPAPGSANLLLNSMLFAKPSAPLTPTPPTKNADGLFNMNTPLGMAGPASISTNSRAGQTLVASSLGAGQPVSALQTANSLAGLSSLVIQAAEPKTDSRDKKTLRLSAQDEAPPTAASASTLQLTSLLFPNSPPVLPQPNSNTGLASEQAVVASPQTSTPALPAASALPTQANTRSATALPELVATAPQPSAPALPAASAVPTQASTRSAPALPELTATALQPSVPALPAASVLPAQTSTRSAPALPGNATAPQPSAPALPTQASTRGAPALPELTATAPQPSATALPGAGALPTQASTPSAPALPGADTAPQPAKTSSLEGPKPVSIAAITQPATAHTQPAAGVTAHAAAQALQATQAPDALAAAQILAGSISAAWVAAKSGTSSQAAELGPDMRLDASAEESVQDAVRLSLSLPVPDLSKRLASKPGNTEVVNWAPLLANLQPNANKAPASGPWENLHLEVPEGFDLEEQEGLLAAPEQDPGNNVGQPTQAGPLARSGTEPAQTARGEAALLAAQAELRTVQQQQLADRLGEAAANRLIAQIERGEWKMQMRLQPGKLGRIDVELSMHARGLEAMFSADSALTRELIVQGTARLKETLAQAGMTVASMTVNGDQTRQSGGNSTPQQGYRAASDALPTKARVEEPRAVAQTTAVTATDRLNILA